MSLMATHTVGRGVVCNCEKQLFLRRPLSLVEFVLATDYKTGNCIACQRGYFCPVGKLEGVQKRIGKFGQET